MLPLQTSELIERKEPVFESRNNRVVVVGVIRVGYKPILFARKEVVIPHTNSGFSITVRC
jgi:hypothetical protein